MTAATSPPLTLPLLLAALVLLLHLTLHARAQFTSVGALVLQYGNKPCLTVGSDGVTLQINPCGGPGAAGSQLFEVADGRIKIAGRCVDAASEAAVQVAPCNPVSATQSFSISSDGKMISTVSGKCVLPLSPSLSGSTLLMGPCASAGTQWSMAAGGAVGGGGGGMQPGGSFPMINGGGNAVNVNGYSPRLDYKTDHFLCVCAVDSDAKPCNTAVRTACQLGHIPSDLCFQSFSQGKHDRIVDEILRLIENGARCSEFDPEKLKQEAANTIALKGGKDDGTPTAEDHYLCVCLDKSNSDKCKSAVKAACLVGHIPAGDCFASLEKNTHDGVTDHVLRLIDNGANCATKLGATKAWNNRPPATGAKRAAFTPAPTDVYLCVCLDDHESTACKNAIRKSCDASRIPREDCQVAFPNLYTSPSFSSRIGRIFGGKASSSTTSSSSSSSNANAQNPSSQGFFAGVTRHVLRLIDNGVRCPAHRGITFTNKGCHCLQSWTADNGKIYTYPNNCGDPANKRGFAWCKTYDDEGCAGVEGSVEWDRCDAPLIPVQRESDEDAADNHYLCVCLDTNSNDEVCVAAVKAGCSVGHLPSEACRASFDTGDHSAVSDSVVAVLRNGERCSGPSMFTAKAGVGAKDGKFCGKGVPDASGKCICLAGYAGKNCEQCSEGFVGFPSCVPKKQCAEVCGPGYVCDYLDGQCDPDPNANRLQWTILYILIFGVILYLLHRRGMLSLGVMVSILGRCLDCCGSCGRGAKEMLSRSRWGGGGDGDVKYSKLGGSSSAGNAIRMNVYDKSGKAKNSDVKRRRPPSSSSRRGGDLGNDEDPANGRDIGGEEDDFDEETGFGGREGEDDDDDDDDDGVELDLDEGEAAEWRKEIAASDTANSRRRKGDDNNTNGNGAQETQVVSKKALKHTGLAI